jgi:hypothetical protein
VNAALFLAISICLVRMVPYSKATADPFSFSRIERTNDNNQDTWVESLSGLLPRLIFSISTGKRSMANKSSHIRNIRQNHYERRQKLYNRRNEISCAHHSRRHHVPAKATCLISGRLTPHRNLDDFFSVITRRERHSRIWVDMGIISLVLGVMVRVIRKGISNL